MPGLQMRCIRSFVRSCQGQGSCWMTLLFGGEGGGEGGGVVGCGEDGDGGEPLGVGIGDTSGVPVLGVGDGLLCGGGCC
jgi:hypothetical protein